MMRRILALGALTLSLSACTSWFDSNQPYLQSSGNIIPGQKVVANQKTTAYAMAKQHGVAMNDLIVINRLPSPFVIWPGQEITLPAGKESRLNAGATPLTSTTNSKLSNYIPNLNRSVTAEELPPPVPQAAGSYVMTPAPARAAQDGRFMWPVEGPLLMGYGPRNSGGMNDGLNIAAPRGAPVLAAENGVVLHAGNDTKGFGNLVLIRHGDDYITAYAHLDRMIVDKDSVIAKGDMIGTVGNTGNVKGPQLHFEIRHKGKAVDPAPLMPPQPEPSPY